MRSKSATKKMTTMELSNYLQSKNVTRYVFSSSYQKECINSYTLRMNIRFKKAGIFYNPNKMFLYGTEEDPEYKGCQVIIERIKFANVEELESGILVEVCCGNINDNSEDHTYSLFAEV